MSKSVPNINTLVVTFKIRSIEDRTVLSGQFSRENTSSRGVSFTP